MIFTYRATCLDIKTQKISNLTRKIDTDSWLEVLRDEQIYGRTAIIVEQELLPLLEQQNLSDACDCLWRLYDIWRAGAGTAIFELAMFVWAGYKKGIYSADVWATMLGFTWQAGARGMLAAVKLSTDQVLEMFNAAPKPILFNAKASDSPEESPFLAYEKMDETIRVFRGVSTGILHHENAFSWSLDIEQAQAFALRNCHNKKEAPGIIMADIRKEAILCVFDYESEIVVNPLVPKIKVVKSFLQGKELKKFHKVFDANRYLNDALSQAPAAKNVLEM